MHINTTDVDLMDFFFPFNSFLIAASPNVITAPPPVNTTAAPPAPTTTVQPTPTTAPPPSPPTTPSTTPTPPPPTTPSTTTPVSTTTPQDSYRYSVFYWRAQKKSLPNRKILIIDCSCWNAEKWNIVYINFSRNLIRPLRCQWRPPRRQWRPHRRQWRPLRCQRRRLQKTHRQPLHADASMEPVLLVASFWLWVWSLSVSSRIKSTNRSSSVIITHFKV